VGTITYVEYSYALNTGFPVAKILNSSGYYVEPTPNNTAVGLLGARVNTNSSSSAYLTADLSRVYTNGDKRAYPLSSYSYIVVPTKVEGTFSENKGRTLGEFAYYFLCEGQRQAPTLGYSPLPINLVQAGLQQVRRIPGVEAQKVDIKKCNNPTFSADGTNLLAKNAPFPSECDKVGVTQCATGTGGAKQSTAASAGGSTSSGGQDSSGSTAAGAATAAGGTAAAAGAVDPETGLAVGGEAAAGGSAVLAGSALTIAKPSGWGLQQTAMVLATVLLLSLMFGPPLLARWMRRPEESA
jgi:phosphate transport system substrate-binding protein